MTETEKRFEAYRKSLWEELIRLTSYIRIYVRLSQRSGDRWDEIMIAPHFFSHISDSLLNSIAIWIEKLYGTTSKHSLLNFLRFVKNNRDIFIAPEQARRRKSDVDRSGNFEEITIDMIKLDCGKIKEIKSLPGFELMRNKFIAHFDKPFLDKSILQKETKITQINWSDFDVYISLGREILNRYSFAYDGHTYEIIDPESFDIDNLLDALHEYIVYNKQRLKNIGV